MNTKEKQLVLRIFIPHNLVNYHLIEIHYNNSLDVLKNNKIEILVKILQEIQYKKELVAIIK